MKFQLEKTREFLDSVMKDDNSKLKHKTKYNYDRGNKDEWVLTQEGRDIYVECVYEDIKDKIIENIDKYFIMVNNYIKKKDKFTNEVSDVIHDIITKLHPNLDIGRYTILWKLPELFKKDFIDKFNKLDKITLKHLIDSMGIGRFSIPYGFPRTIEKNMDSEVVKCYTIPDFKCGYAIIKTKKKMIGFVISTTTEGDYTTTKLTPKSLLEVDEKIDELVSKDLSLIAINNDEHSGELNKRIKREKRKTIVENL